jgi:thiol-disulfide isomerase/thioredoxin
MLLIQLLLVSLGIVVAPGAPQITIRDITGMLLSPFSPSEKGNVLFFISSDCPISNSYAPEIQRICREYGSRGVGCALFYEDLNIGTTAVRRHIDEYGYGRIPAAIDSERHIANRAKATITPEAVVIDAKGQIRYRGRIDNFYAGLGKPRQQVTVHDVRDALDAVLAGKPVQNSETQAFGCFIAPPDLLKR